MNKAPFIFGSIALLTTAAAYGCGNSTTSTTTTAGTGGTAASSTHATTGTTSTTATTGTTGPGGNGAGGSGGGAAVNCNPFSGAPCNVAAGDTCDYVGDFECFSSPPVNDVLVCGDCGSAAASGDFCALGGTCLGGKCFAFCCNDGDCGTGGKCDLTVIGDPMVGVCVIPPAADAGMPDGGADPVPACGAPVKAPSNGSCFTG